MVLFPSLATAQTPGPVPSGGPVSLSAESIEHEARAKIIRAKKNVVIKYGNRVIKGQKGELNHETGEGFLTGGVSMEEPELSMEGGKVEFNLKTGTGSLYKSKGKISPSFYFTGVRIDRTAPDHFEIEEGTCSTCPFPDQDWRIEASTISLTIEGYAWVTGMTFLAGDVPVFYLPYFVIPTKTKRATGFLIPSPSYSGRNGFNLTTRFFWALADNADATISHNHRGSEGEGGELELRYVFSEKTKGQLNSEYFSQNPTEGQPRKELWTLLYNHFHSLPLGVENLIRVDMESKDSIAKRWEDNLAQRSRRNTDSFFFLRKNWSTASLNAGARSFQSVVPGVDQRFDEIPSVSFISQKQSLAGLPVYWFLDSGYNGFRFQETPPDGGATQKYDVDRMDFSPGLSTVLAPAPWISLEPEVRYRATWYSAGLDSAGAREASPFVRDFYTVSTLLTGPRLYRIFDPEEGVRVKHIITPKIYWRYIPGYDYDGADRQKVRPFDGVDLSAPANAVTFTLMNQILFREAAGPDGEANVTERVKFNIEQSYDLNEASRTETLETPRRPLAATVLSLRTLPANWLMINVVGQYNTYESRLDAFHIETGFKKDGYFNFALDHVDTYPANAWDTVYLELNLTDKATFDISGVYSETGKYLSNAAARLFYRAGCWGFGLSLIQKKNTLADSATGTTGKDETKVMFSLDLLGMGDSVGEVAAPVAGRKL